ncbi:hypothetical protein [Pontimicrobium sp. MEBiC06410]
MRKVVFFFILLSVTSCNYFDAKKIATEDILKEELKTFNWNEVDAYPVFASCENSIEKKDRKQCFENTLSSYITNSLATETIIVTQDINDTILLELQISEVGALHLKSIKVDSITRVEIPNIETLLYNSLQSLPKIYPALKRDKPVKTEFKLPIVINVN